VSGGLFSPAVRFSHRRQLASILLAPFEPRHYVAAGNMLRLYPRPWQEFTRYLTGRGTYPYRCRIRTPIGTVAPMLYSPDDMLTVNEIFCRLDYAAPSDLRVAVDLGSNIGISALYFLTRNRTARAYLFEPNPANVERLARNLAGFEDRYVLDTRAVADVAGEVDFGIEDTGRYGGIGIDTGQSIRVEARHVNDVLGRILEREPRIDLLKVDTEGLEVRTVRAIRSDLLDRIDLIYLESGGVGERLHPAHFIQTTRYSCERLVRRQAASGHT
jgi:FkbM family methyltransferase